MEQRIVSFAGLAVRIGAPRKCGDGRYRARRYLMDPCRQKKTIPMASDEIVARDLEEFYTKANNVLPLIRANWGYIRCLYLTGAYSIPLGLYAAIFMEEIAYESELDEDECREIWENIMQPTMGQLAIRDTQKIRDELSALVTPSGKRAISDDGRSCWRLMDAIYAHIRETRYVNDELCRIILNRKKPTALADAMEHIKRRSVALCELQAIVIACINMIDHLDPMGCVLSMIYLLGIDVEEVCALQLSDWVVDRITGISALHISKIAKMVMDRWGVKAAVVGPCERKSQYRRIVCSTLIEQILRRYIRQCVKNRQHTVPWLFADDDGNMITPDAVKVALKQIQHGFVRDDGVTMGGHEYSEIVRSGIHLHSAEWYYRAICGMESDMWRYIRGYLPETTLAQWYADMGATGMMMRLRAHMEQWHCLLQTPDLETTLGEYHVLITGHAHRGDMLTIDSRGGGSMVISGKGII